MHLCRRCVEARFRIAPVALHTPNLLAASISVWPHSIFVAVARHGIAEHAGPGSRNPDLELPSCSQVFWIVFGISAWDLGGAFCFELCSGLFS